MGGEKGKNSYKMGSRRLTNWTLIIKKIYDSLFGHLVEILHFSSPTYFCKCVFDVYYHVAKGLQKQRIRIIASVFEVMCWLK